LGLPGGGKYPQDQLTLQPFFALEAGFKRNFQEKTKTLTTAARWIELQKSKSST
jgi:hypothetical protein